MNIKRFLLATLALFVFIFVYESFIHGFLLQDLYSETPNLWRSYDQMLNFIAFNIVIEVIIALWLTFIFTRFFPQGGVSNGFRFGFYIGVLSAIQAAAAYFYLPISLMLSGSWFAAYLIESILGGLILGAIYKR